MSQKGDTLSVIAKIVEQWLMVNCDLDVEKVLDLKEFIESLDVPPSFKLKDGTMIDVNGNNGHDVEIKRPIESGKDVAERIDNAYHTFDKNSDTFKSLIAEFHKRAKGIAFYIAPLLEIGFSFEVAHKKAVELWEESEGKKQYSLNDVHNGCARHEKGVIDIKETK